jgi:hypothetical protein
MDDLGIFTDNIEGITFGPKLCGKQSLLFISTTSLTNRKRKYYFLK